MDAAPRPEPTSPRWKPLRLGLVNVFRYDDQQFWFEDGHLLLRGDNGAGKSRVLAMTLPFLFDGEARPERVEPDGDRNKNVAWNLHMGEHDRRRGYAWVEFGRVDEDGTHRFVSLAIGMDAARGRTRLDRWFFAGPRRVGPGEEEVRLELPDGYPALEKDLRARFPAEVFRSAGAYRAEVDRLLFGLGADRYRSLVELLIELRRPQLSRGLDEGRLQRMLSGSLRPVPESSLAAAAEAFDGLDRQKSELEQLRVAEAAASGFLGVYGRYARSAARRLAAPVRKTHSVYEASMKEARKRAAEAEEADAALAGLQKRREALRRERSESAGMLAALRASPELRSAEQLARLARQAREAAERSRDAAARAEAAAGDRAQAAAGLEAEEASLAAREGTVGERAREAASAAEAAALAERHAAAVEPLGDEPGPAPAREAAVLGRLRELSQTQAGSVHRLRELRGEREEERRAAASREEAARAQRSRLEEASAAAAAAGGAVREAASAFLDGFAGWSASLEELPLDAGPVRTQLEAWAEAVASGAGWPDPGMTVSPLSVAVADAADRRRGELAAERARVEGRLAALAEAGAELRRTREELAAGRHEPPPTPHTRGGDARPTGRPGAPLWRLVNFREGVGEAERAGIEAGLEAAGLLDAWVEPGGSAEPAADDAALLAAGVPEPEGRTLADALEVDGAAADEAGGVEPDTVREILAHVAWSGKGATCVDADGSFRLGPLVGRWSKRAAQHIGASARAAQRKRRLAELDAEIERNAAGAASARSEAERLDARNAALRRELAAEPRPAALLSARTRLDAAEARVTDERKLLIEAEAREREARSAAEAAAAALAREAEASGLTAHVDRLDELAERVAAHRNAVDRLGDAWVARAEAAERVARAGEAVGLAASRLTAASSAAAKAAEDAAERRSEHAALDETLGDGVREVQRKLQAAEAREREVEGELEEVGSAVEAAAAGAATARAGRDAAEARRLEHEELRDAEIEKLFDFVREGFLDACGDGLPGDLPAADAPWSATRGVEVARRIDDGFSEPYTDSAYDRVSRALEDAFHTLKDELARQNHTATMDPLFGGTVRKVSVRLGREARPVHEVAQRLAERIEHRDLMLRAEERKVVEEFLLERVGAELHACMDRARRLVLTMSEELESHTTATGMKLRFRWELDEDDEDLQSTKEAVALLLRSPVQQTAADRDALARFLQGRIQRTREGREREQASASWAEALAEALDYRAWHRFHVERRMGPDAPWKRMTRAVFGTGSGGEKALMLTLPQFAAASAHYRSAEPTAPRLVMLDEAFAGIDANNRGQAMGVLQKFDLDFVMTSDRERGCYPQLLGNAIYHLATSPGIDAVLCTRQVWNGTDVEDPAEHAGAFSPA